MKNDELIEFGTMYELITGLIADPTITSEEYKNAFEKLSPDVQKFYIQTSQKQKLSLACDFYRNIFTNRIITDFAEEFKKLNSLTFEEQGKIAADIIDKFSLSLGQITNYKDNEILAIVQVRLTKSHHENLIREAKKSLSEEEMLSYELNAVHSIMNDTSCEESFSKSGDISIKEIKDNIKKCPMLLQSYFLLALENHFFDAFKYLARELDKSAGIWTKTTLYNEQNTVYEAMGRKIARSNSNIFDSKLIFNDFKKLEFLIDLIPNEYERSKRILELVENAKKLKNAEALSFLQDYSRQIEDEKEEIKLKSFAERFGGRRGSPQYR